MEGAQDIIGICKAVRCGSTLWRSINDACFSVRIVVLKEEEQSNVSFNKRPEMYHLGTQHSHSVCFEL